MASLETNQLIEAYLDNELSSQELRLFREMLKKDRHLQKQLLLESCFHLSVRINLTAVTQADCALNNLDEAVLLDQQVDHRPFLPSALDTNSTTAGFGDVLSTTIMNALSSPKFLWFIMLFSASLFSTMFFMLLPTDATLEGPHPIERVTHISQEIDAVWGEGIERKDLRMLLEGTRLDLRSGLAQVEYKNGVRVNLEGPTIFVASGENEGDLLLGKVSAQITKGGEKFAITTPSGRITDLGTEFGVVVDSEQNTDVQVFDGKVELAIQGEGGTTKKIELVETDAIRINRPPSSNTQKQTITKILYTPLRFARCYNKLKPYYYDDFSIDTAENYTLSSVSGSDKGNSFSIENGILSVNADQDICSVISKLPLLGVGDTFMVDVPGVNPEVSAVSILVSTQAKGGMGGTYGFRLRRDRGIVIEKFDSTQSSLDHPSKRILEDTRIDDPLFGRPIRLVIERFSATGFVFYYESNDGRRRITDLTEHPDLGNSNRLYVGVEVHSYNQPKTEDFDNLVVYPAENNN